MSVMNERRLMGSLPADPVEHVETITGRSVLCVTANWTAHFRIGSMLLKNPVIGATPLRRERFKADFLSHSHDPTPRMRY
jgi:hypothetical protein